MSISIKEAIKAPFKDDKWIIKLGIISLISVIPALLALISDIDVFILTRLAFLILAGYSIVYLNRLLAKDENLPALDFIKIFKVVVQSIIVLIGYNIILSPVFSILFNLTFSKIPLSIFATILFFLYGIFCLFIIIPISLCLFSKNFRITEAYDFRNVYKLSKAALIWNFFKAAFKVFLIALILVIIINIIERPLQFINQKLNELLVIPFWVYLTLVGTYLYSQAFIETEENQ